LTSPTGKAALAAAPDRNTSSAAEPLAEPPGSAPLVAIPLQDFESIYREHFDFACRSLRVLGVAVDALEDAAQDVFGIASRKLAEFEGNSSIKTWIFAIVQRVAANQRRTDRRKRAPLEPLALESAAAEAPSPESQAQSAQSAALIQAFCDGLDEGRRTLLVLGLIEGVPMRELASSLGVPLQTAYSRARVLRKDLEHYLRRCEVDHE
jgi:RNA polymerase sigma-70 factor, ECF subfamily